MITVDTEQGIVTTCEGGRKVTHSIGSPEAFALISQVWLRAGWDTKYVYSFTWMGRPIIQLPEDLLRIQEVIFSLKPDVIIETGVAHGGSLVFYASLCKAMQKGQVIGVDIEIRPHNRQAIEAHELSPLITLIEGNSVEPQTVAAVTSRIQPGSTVLVLLDSCHTKDHVLAELEAYGPLVSKGSYIVAMDGIMQQFCGAPRSQPDWGANNPQAAAREFVKTNPGFVLESPSFCFNEGSVVDRVTYWPNGFIKRIW